MKVKNHREVEVLLGQHNWKPMSDKPENGWVDYLYEPPNHTEEIQPIARLPAPPLRLQDSWKFASFQASLECVQQFANQVTTVMKDEIFVVEEKDKKYFNW